MTGGDTRARRPVRPRAPARPSFSTGSPWVTSTRSKSISSSVLERRRAWRAEPLAALVGDRALDPEAQAAVDADDPVAERQRAEAGQLQRPLLQPRDAVHDQAERQVRVADRTACRRAAAARTSGWPRSTPPQRPTASARAAHVVRDRHRDDDVAGHDVQLGSILAVEQRVDQHRPAVDVDRVAADLGAELGARMPLRDGAASSARGRRRARLTPRRSRTRSPARRAARRRGRRAGAPRRPRPRRPPTPGRRRGRRA